MMMHDEHAKNTSNGECQPKNTKSIDVIIVGAGVAGSALAHTLVKDGRQVHVIERNLNEPNTIVGELLQPGGYLKLIELGLEDCVNGIDAQKVLGYTLCMDGKCIELPYPMEIFYFDVAGRSFHRGRFVQKTARKSSISSQLEQGTVTSLLERGGTIKGVEYKTKTGQKMTAYASLTVVCDGCFSSLRRSASLRYKPSHFAALLLENCQLPFKNYAHVTLGDPSFMFFYPISFLLDLPGKNIPSISNGEMACYLQNKVAPQIPSELHDAFISSIDKRQIKTMPISCMPAMPYSTPGAILLGDALNMRHAITGGGMTAALFDVLLLRNLLQPLNNLNDTFQVAKLFYPTRKVGSASHNEGRKEIRDACFDYLNLGQNFSRGPVTLISGLDPKPLSLVFQFLVVAMYSVGLLLLPVLSPKRVAAAARLILGASAIILPLILEGIKQVFFTSNILEKTEKKSLLIERKESQKLRNSSKIIPLKTKETIM